MKVDNSKKYQVSGALLNKLLSDASETTLRQIELADIRVVNNYSLIPMNEIDEEARLIAVRWHENATNWIGDKHKLASDIMNYARRKQWK